MSDVVDRLNAALAGRYRIIREVGEGGMAHVYLAEDERHRRQPEFQEEVDQVKEALLRLGGDRPRGE